MKTQIVIILSACLLVLGCSDATLYGAGDPAAFSLSRERSSGDFMAYEHSLVVDVREDDIDVAYNAVVEACSSEQEFVCRVLGSSIEYGDYKYAQVSMRIEPAGIDEIAKAAVKFGTVVRRHTNVEDLAKTITDLDSRILILTTTRDKLLVLEESEANDIDSLIKITTELTRIQSELEQLTGQSAFQHQRVDMEILSIQFVVERSRSFWKPIVTSLTTFGRRLSEGIADTVSAVAYLLPWSVLLIGIGYLLRVFWRRRRSG